MVVNPLGWIAIAGWAVAFLAGGAGLVGYEIEAKHFADEKAAFDKFKGDAATKALNAQVAATELSNESIQKVNAALAAATKTQTVYRDRIVHDTPSACPPSAAAIDASFGLRATVTGRSDLEPAATK